MVIKGMFNKLLPKFSDLINIISYINFVTKNLKVSSLGDPGFGYLMRLWVDITQGCSYSKVLIGLDNIEGLA